ncbi:hypothetical protein [Curtobacterium sp. KBS0715]|jgi:hypothetical protein|uniref:hypothetical protein n=1 Tax=Curtobacterium sp. KBS0715 TaxID=1179671 RepID=UPI00110DDC85|nr:hypothetical protein [Curtobacterium sp. KBS0715]TSD11628.1 hypothetical protein FFG40_008825 [Curtobacterium sp. KBS0715]
MLLTVTPVHGWWSAGAVAGGIDVDAAELTFWGPLTDALLLAAAMLLPQMLTWVTTPGGRVSDRAIRHLLEVEAHRDRPDNT